MKSIFLCTSERGGGTPVEKVAFFFLFFVFFVTNKNLVEKMPQEKREGERIHFCHSDTTPNLY